MSCTLLALLIVAVVIVTINAKPPQFETEMTFTETTIGPMVSVFALDEQNQRAYTKINFRTTSHDIWLQKRMPFAIEGTPEAMNFVELHYQRDNRTENYYCEYR